MFRNLPTLALGFSSILFSMISSRICEAQLLSAYEQAYGLWDIQLAKHVLSRRRWYLPTPEYEESDTTGQKKEVTKKKKKKKKEEEDGDLQLMFPENDQLVHCNAISIKAVRSVSCLLNLEKNGKFSLILSEDGRRSYTGKNLSSRKYECNDPIVNSTSMMMQQPLQGEWFLTPNPYCVTDRHYDTLLLVSKPRVRMRHDRHSATRIIETATVEMRCKVWGRYSGGAIRRAIGLKHGRIRGRISHGTIVIVKEREETANGNKMKRVLVTREIVGAFDGRALVEPETTNESDEFDNCGVDKDEGEEGVEEFDGLL